MRTLRRTARLGLSFSLPARLVCFRTRDSKKYALYQRLQTVGYVPPGGQRLPLEVGGQAVLGRQLQTATPWLTERHGYDPTCSVGLLPHAGQ